VGRRSYASPTDDGWSGSGRASVPAPGASGRASAGRASVGSARVGSGSYGVSPTSPGPTGSASVGSASVGSASVGSASAGRARVGGRASVPPASDDGYRPAGRAAVGSASVGSASVGSASVGSASVGGRASVGRARAAVRPVSPAGPGGDGGPGGRTRRGRRQRGGNGENLSPDAALRAKKRKRMNILIASSAVFIMLAGVGLVGFTWFYDEVQTPTDFGEPEATTITYSDGSQLAKLGVQNRTIVPVDKISPIVKHAVMAAEDKNFEKHGGIDVKGIMRAAWNNFTGGATQGASTITQQYARHVADLSGINYARKIREAVLASKLEQQLGKDTILGYYLNAIYFGRGAHGIEAAAQTYFGKSVLTPPGDPKALTVAEAAVLASVIKQPEPDPVTGHKGFDPQVNLPAAKDRWNYTLNNMLEMGWITKEERAAAVYPEETLKEFDPKKNCVIDCGIDKPTGNVINYVRAELEQMGLADDWKKGGYRIKTTINKAAQRAAENAARRASKTSPMSKLSDKYMAALVAINPTNGEVLAYYGGENGTGTDYAGLNIEGGKLTGGHPPGSTFKVYTLAAAMREGIAMDSHWDATKDRDPERREAPISNANRTNLKCPNAGKYCTLSQSTVESYNVPFYWITKEIGADKVLAAARDAGIKTMWPDNGDAIDIVNNEPSKIAPSKFDIEIGFGQYAVTVFDHASGMATLANRGKRYEPHFIASVEKRDPVTGKFVKVNGAQLKVKQVFEPAQMDDILATLEKIPPNIGNALAGGRPAAGKTGTWELGDGSRNNGDAWMIGATRQIAAAVWVGSKRNRVALKEANGSAMSGGGTPAAIWEQFMEEAHAAMKLPQKRFEPAKNVGDPNHPAANGIAPPPPPPTNPQTPSNCNNPFGFFCPPNNGQPGPNNPNPGFPPQPGDQGGDQNPGGGDGGLGGGRPPRQPAGPTTD